MTRAENRERTRQRLFDAAALRIAEKGLAAISVEEIAARAAYPRGAFYSNLRSKGDLFVELLRLEHENFCENLQAMIDGAPSNEDAQKQFASCTVGAHRISNGVVARRHEASRLCVGRAHLSGLSHCLGGHLAALRAGVPGSGRSLNAGSTTILRRRVCRR